MWIVTLEGTFSGQHCRTSAIFEHRFVADLVVDLMLETGWNVSIKEFHLLPRMLTAFIKETIESEEE